MNVPVLPKLKAPAILLSYWYMRNTPFGLDVIDALSDRVPMLVDSGAFSNFTSGTKAARFGKVHNPVTLADYIAACKKFHGRLWNYITLDVIGNAVETQSNLDAMYDAGLTPMPVCTMANEPAHVAVLAKYHPFVCVAGAVGTRGDYIVQRYQRAAAAAPEAYLHALGFVRWPTIMQVPLLSGDSSSWCAGGRYGALNRFAPGRGIMSYQWQHFGERSRDSLDWLRYAIECGVTVEQLQDKQTYFTTRGFPALSTAAANVGMACALADHGRLMFFAVPNLQWLNNLFAVVATYDYRTCRFDWPLTLEVKALYDARLAEQNLDRYMQAIDEVSLSRAWSREEAQWPGYGAPPYATPQPPTEESEPCPSPPAP